LLAWLTLFPVIGPLPQISHFLDIKQPHVYPQELFIALAHENEYRDKDPETDDLSNKAQII
jgi:hypothetical protein